MARIPKIREHDPAVEIPEDERGAVYRRIYKEARWPEASKFKSKRLRFWRNKHYDRKCALGRAWFDMDQHFTPIPPVQGMSKKEKRMEVEKVELQPRDQSAGAQQDFVEDAMWAYESLNAKGMDPKKAPSPGAWGLLIWARDNRDKFFSTVFPKALAMVNKEEEDDPEVKKELANIDDLWQKLDDSSGS